MASAKPIGVSKSNTMSFNSNSAVTIRVGKVPKTEDFIAHESFLTSRSEFFRRALSGNWKEAETRIVNLPDDEPNTFALYINHVYTSQLPIVTKTAEELKLLKQEGFDRHIKQQYEILFSVLVLGEKLQDLAMKNVAMEAALATTELVGPDNLRQIPGIDIVRTIYKGTPPNSPARRFVTDLWTGISISKILRRFRSLPKDFVKDLGESIDKARPCSLENIATKNGITVYQEKPRED